MLIDLHLHSTFSDGLLTVEQLVKKAKQKKIKLLALTDHDTLAGARLFQKLCAKDGLRGVPGVEISTDYQGLDLHIVAYHPRRRLAPFWRHLGLQQKKRKERARIVIKKLKQFGLFFSPETERHLLKQANVGKPHLGRAVLAERRNRLILRKLFNFQGSLSDFIAKFLDKPGQPAYVPKTKISALAALKLIRSAGARAVLAHPDLDLTSRSLAVRVISRLKKAGLSGLEMPNRRGRARPFYRRLARRLGLFVTYGSDSHDGRGMGVKIREEEGRDLIQSLDFNIG